MTHPSDVVTIENIAEDLVRKMRETGETAHDKFDGMTVFVSPGESAAACVARYEAATDKRAEKEAKVESAKEAARNKAAGGAPEEPDESGGR